MHDWIPACFIEQESGRYEDNRYDTVYPDVMVKSVHIAI